MTQTHAPRKRRLLAAGLALCLAWGLSAGCRDRQKEVSDYPFFVEMLNNRWEEALASLRSDKPNINLPRVIVNDMALTIATLKTSYDHPNRDAAIAKLEELYARYSADIQTKINMMSIDTSLRPGVTEKDVLACVEKAHQDYQQFKSMVVVKK